MIRLLLFHASYFIAPHASHHLALGSYTLIYTGSRRAGIGVQVEQAQANDFTNLAFDKGKLPYINQCSLSFILNISLSFPFTVH
jgi:hypothetical protein